MHRPRRHARNAFLVIFLLAPVALEAQAQTRLENRLRARIETAYMADSMDVMDDRVYARNMLQRAYTARGFRPFWVTEDGLTERGQQLTDWLKSAPPKHGLRAADYHRASVAELETEGRDAALVDLDLALSDAFLMVGSHFLAGRLNPETLDSEWHANRRHRDLLPVIEKAATMRSPGDALIDLLPQDQGYTRLVQRLARLREIRTRGGWTAVSEGQTLRSGEDDARVQEVAERLRLSGDYNGEVTRTYGPDLASAVRQFQTLRGLNPDAAIGRATLRALNVTVQTDIDRIIVNLERWRWLPENLGERYIIVNIAGFNLDVIDGGEKRLSMRVVVGQPYRRTPVFSGTMTYLVLNPWWEVPPSIAVKDKLPVIKRDPSYLSRQRFIVLQGWGADEVAVDPASVDWASVTARNFRYRLRQAPGPQNALGRVKFMFPNAHSVYLHDTPARELFAKESRSFSSGCIRLERPLELAELLLAGTNQWNGAAIDRAIEAGKETVVRLRQSVPVHLLYWTAWDDENAMQYREDIYGRDVRVLHELREPPPEADDDTA